MTLHGDFALFERRLSEHGLCFIRCIGIGVRGAPGIIEDLSDSGGLVPDSAIGRPGPSLTYDQESGSADLEAASDPGSVSTGDFQTTPGGDIPAGGGPGNLVLTQVMPADASAAGDPTSGGGVLSTIGSFFTGVGGSLLSGVDAFLGIPDAASLADAALLSSSPGVPYGFTGTYVTGVGTLVTIIPAGGWMEFTPGGDVVSQGGPTDLPPPAAPPGTLIPGFNAPVEPGSVVPPGEDIYADVGTENDAAVYEDQADPIDPTEQRLLKKRGAQTDAASAGSASDRQLQRLDREDGGGSDPTAYAPLGNELGADVLGKQGTSLLADPGLARFTIQVAPTAPQGIVQQALAAAPAPSWSDPATVYDTAATSAQPTPEAAQIVPTDASADFYGLSGSSFVVPAQPQGALEQALAAARGTPDPASIYDEFATPGLIPPDPFSGSATDVTALSAPASTSTSATILRFVGAVLAGGLGTGLQFGSEGGAQVPPTVVNDTLAQLTEEGAGAGELGVAEGVALETTPYLARLGYIGAGLAAGIGLVVGYERLTREEEVPSDGYSGYFITEPDATTQGEAGEPAIDPLGDPAYFPTSPIDAQKTPVGFPSDQPDQPTAGERPAPTVGESPDESSNIATAAEDPTLQRTPEQIADDIIDKKGWDAYQNEWPEFPEAEDLKQYIIDIINDPEDSKQGRNGRMIFLYEDTVIIEGAPGEDGAVIRKATPEAAEKYYKDQR